MIRILLLFVVLYTSGLPATESASTLTITPDESVIQDVTNQSAPKVQSEVSQNKERGSELDVNKMPICSKPHDTNCIIYEKGEEVSVRVKSANQFGALIPVASKYFEGITSLDLSSIVTGIKGIFGGSTDHFAQKLNKEDHQALKDSERLYDSVQLLFTGMMKEEQELHTEFMRRMEVTEMEENTILAEVLTFLKELKVYQFYLFIIQSAFYGFVTLVFLANFYRNGPR